MNAEFAACDLSRVTKQERIGTYLMRSCPPNVTLTPRQIVSDLQRCQLSKTAKRLSKNGSVPKIVAVVCLSVPERQRKRE